MWPFLSNGEWMATVDMCDDKVNTSELFLKSCQWDSNTQSYKLYTRVDYPHTKPIISLIFNLSSRKGPMTITTTKKTTRYLKNLIIFSSLFFCSFVLNFALIKILN